MDYSLANLDFWFEHFMQLSERESTTSERYLKNYKRYNRIHNSDLYYDTPEKIKLFDDTRQNLITLLKKDFSENDLVRKEILSHARILPKGPYFKVNLNSENYKINRDSAYLNIHIKKGIGKYDFMEKVKFKFLDVLPSWN